MDSQTKENYAKFNMSEQVHNDNPYRFPDCIFLVALWHLSAWES